MTQYLTELVRKFDASQDASQDARNEAERARDYYDGRQLTDDQIKALKKRKQPIVIENLIRPKVDYLCGLERQSRTDPKAYPRTAMHDDDANAVTDALRYVTEDQDFPIKRSSVFQHMLVEGFGGVEVFARQTRDGIDPVITLIDWDRLFYDPHSCRADFSDAQYLGYVTWMDDETAKRRWPGREDVIDNAFRAGGASVAETYDDKPKWKSWVDSTRKRVRIVTIYDRSRGDWERCVYTLSGELEDCAPVPFLDEEGKPECALILQSAYVDRDNDRYGLVRDYMTLQDEVNKRRSKFLHLANSRPIRVDPASGLNPEEARAEFNRPDGVLVAGSGEIEDLTSQSMAAGHFNLLAEAKQAIQLVGPNATMQGKAGQDQSGRAILALQQGGMTELAPILDALRHFNVRVYRAVWNRIRQYWTGERWVRVTDDEKNVRFVGLNTTQGSLVAAKLRDALKSGKIDQQQAMMFAQQAQADPAMMEPANAIAQLDVDIAIDEVADTATVQFEQFDQLTKLIPAAPPQYIPTMFRLMIEASSLRNKDKLLKVADEMEQPQANPLQDQALMLQMAGEQAKVEKTQSETAENYAQIASMQVKDQLSAFQSGVGLAA
jgi:hypothetical protein